MSVLTRTQLVNTEASLSPKRRRKGATALEYLMMMSLIIVVCLAAIGYLGTANSANLNTSSNKISTSLKKSS